MKTELLRKFLNKKGLLFNEIIWIIKLVLFFVIIGAILYYGAQASGFNLGDWFAKGLGSWSHVNSTNITAVVT